MDVERRVVAILERAVRATPGTVRPDSVFAEMEGWDSMGVVDVLGTLYDEFGVVIGVDELADLPTVADVVRRVSGPP